MLNIKDIVIDPELKDYLRNLKVDEREALVDSVKKDGYSEPLIVWLNHAILVDGHNRHSVWQDELGCDPDKAPEIVEKHFADKNAVKEYMARKQLGRRNLNDAERVKFALLLKPALEQQAKSNQKQSGGRGEKGSENSTNLKPIDTRQEIAKAAGVSTNTVSKVEKVLKSAPEQVKNDMLDGKVSINKAHETVKPKKPKAEPATEEPPQERKSQFDPEEIESSGKSSSKSSAENNKLAAKLDGLIEKFDREAKALLDSLGPLVRCIDDCNAAKLAPNHKLLIATYQRLHGELSKAKATSSQLSKAWKLRK